MNVNSALCVQDRGRLFFSIPLVNSSARGGINYHETSFLSPCYVLSGGGGEGRRVGGGRKGVHVSQGKKGEGAPINFPQNKSQAWVPPALPCAAKREALHRSKYPLGPLFVNMYPYPGVSACEQVYSNEVAQGRGRGK